MANTFSQIYIQTVFAVSGRMSLIKPDFKEDLYKYIAGIIRNQGQKLISINGMPDHLHILIGLKPSRALADLVRDIKADSSTFINKNQWVHGRFSMAGGLRRIFLRTFAARNNHPLHSESRKASQPAYFQIRIPKPAEEI
jgi:REP element-mobilizing transposase RayT